MELEGEACGQVCARPGAASRGLRVAEGGAVSQSGDGKARVSLPTRLEVGRGSLLPPPAPGLTWPVDLSLQSSP